MQPARRAELNGEIDEWPSGSNQGDLLGGRQDSGRDCSNVRGEIPSNLKDSERGSPEGTSGSYSRLLASPIIGEPEEKQQGAISWCIVGGESGPNARPMHPDWVRSLRDQCQAAGVPFFLKQWGEWEEETFSDEHAAIPDSRTFAFGDGVTMVRTGKKAAGRLLDGKTWNELPR